MTEAIAFDDRQNGIAFHNSTDETVPPYAVMQLDYEFGDGKSATFERDGDTVFRIIKPDSRGVDKPSKLLFNGPFQVLNGGYGFAQLSSVRLALCDFNLGDPTPGSTIGAKDDEWHMSVEGAGFKVKTQDDLPSYEHSDVEPIKTVWIELATGGEGSHYLFTLTSAMSSGDGTATIRSMADDMEIETGATVVDTLSFFDGLISGQRGICVKQDGAYYAVGPYVTDVRWDDPDLEYTKDDGTNWENINTAQDCT